jgi:NADP-dependent 3-hydroxy acid dehydrogenase YdfG
MDLGLTGKVVLVSGGAKGIGEGIVRVLSAEGAVPVIIGRNKEDNEKLVQELTSGGGTAGQVVAELSDPEACEKAVTTVIESYGSIYGLVNNAGVNDGVNLEHGDYKKFLQSVHSNLVHYYLLAHFALPKLKEAKGAIVNIGSKTAETGQGGTSAYAASNGGRNALNPRMGGGTAEVRHPGERGDRCRMHDADVRKLAANAAQPRGKTKRDYKPHSAGKTHDNGRRNRQHGSFSPLYP